MRCTCCDAILNDYEATMRHAITKQFIEICGTCLKTIDAYIPIQVRNDLASEHDSAIADSLLDDGGDYVEDGGDDEQQDDYWAER